MFPQIKHNELLFSKTHESKLDGSPYNFRQNNYFN